MHLRGFKGICLGSEVARRLCGYDEASGRNAEDGYMRRYSIPLIHIDFSGRIAVQILVHVLPLVIVVVNYNIVRFRDNLGDLRI